MTTRYFMVAVLVAACAACGRSQQTPSVAESSGDPWFVECAEAAGLDFVHVSARERRFFFPEIMSGGVGLLDHDGDGDLDVYLVQGGDVLGEGQDANRLFSNRGDGTFVDVTAAAGVGDTSYGMGCAAADFDGDGDVDLYVTNLGANVLYRNDAGRFTDVTAAAGVGDPGWSTSACFADYDADGDHDLFVANYVRWAPDTEIECFSPGNRRDYCHPNAYEAPAPDTLYRNEGDGTFTDVSAELGIDAAFGNGLGVVAGDLDGDGRCDFYVANDMTPNQLWLQGADGRFQDQALLAGCALSGAGYPEAGMGVQAVDLESDGDLDLFMVHMRHQKNTFYENRGSGVFADEGAERGLSAASLPFTGFGLGFSDFDQDGDLDLYVANGRVVIEDPSLDPDDPYAEDDLVLEQTAPGRFAERRPRGGVRPRLLATGRAAAFGDLDGDLDVDVVVVNRDAAVHLLRNEASHAGSAVLLRVLDSKGADAIGARVGVEVDGSVRWLRVDPCYGYCTTNDPRVHVGLGAARRLDDVRVRWVDGREEAFGPLEGDAIHVLRHGAGR